MKQRTLATVALGAFFVLLGFKAPTLQNSAPNQIGANSTSDVNQVSRGENGEQAVRIIAAPKIATESEKDLWDRALVVATWLLVCIGAGQIILLWRTVIATRDNARAALLNTEVIVNAERAWISVSVGWQDAARITEAENQTNLALKFSYRNEGKTPAWILERRIDFIVVTEPPNQPDFDAIEQPIYSFHCISAGGIDDTDDDRMVSAHDKMDRNNHKQGLVYGFVKYRDIFGRERRTTFGYAVFGHIQVIERITDRQYNEYT